MGQLLKKKTETNMLSRKIFSCDTFASASCTTQSQTFAGQVFAQISHAIFFSSEMQCEKFSNAFNQDPNLEEAVLHYARDNLALVKVLNLTNYDHVSE